MQWETIIASTVTAVLGAAGAGVPLWLKLRRGTVDIRKVDDELERTERADVTGYYTRIIERNEREIGTLNTKISTLESTCARLTTENVQCQREAANTTAKLQVLEFQVGQLQKMATAATVSVLTTVTADQTGQIVDADEGIREIVGWRAAELIGQNVDIIIPQDVRGKHHAGLERARVSGEVRPANVAIQTHALHRSGERVPVIVSLNRWTDGQGRALITAQIVHRRVFETVSPPGTGEHPTLQTNGPPATKATTDSGVWKTVK